MSKREESAPYIPSYAGLIRFREESAKFILKPQDLYFLILVFAGIVLLLNVFA